MPFARRDILRAGVAAAGLIAFRRPLWAATPGRTLSLYCVNTGECEVVEYFDGAAYPSDALATVEHLFRDYRTGETHPIDPELLELLRTLQDRLGSSGAVHVLSAYRSPATNRAKRLAGRAVARRSFHLVGQAVDFFLPGCELADVRDAALDLGVGGVGYYPRSGFVHVDTGPPRTWQGDRPRRVARRSRKARSQPPKKRRVAK